MIKNLMNWGIFGIVAIAWSHASTWAVGNGSAELSMLAISLITMSLMVGKTSGGNGVEHIISGAKGFLNLVLGWLVAVVVYNVIYSLISTGGLDVATLVNLVIGAMVVVLASIVTFSALNAVRQ